jgi:THO complex subunit 2
VHLVLFFDLISFALLYRPEFYVTFWQLSMFDLLPPDVKVASEREKIAGFMASKNSDSQPPRDKRAADFMNHYNQDLLDEFRNQVTAREQTGLRLRKEMKYWFRG